VIDRLADDPERQGKALLGELAGFRSIRAVGQRNRIIYQIRGNEIVVVIVAVGIRRDGARDDIYNLAKKAFQAEIVKRVKMYLSKFAEVISEDALLQMEKKEYDQAPSHTR